VDAEVVEDDVAHVLQRDLLYGHGPGVEGSLSLVMMRSLLTELAMTI
jgi:hypothetical protein